jgi:HEPN domain-containing protein
MQPEAVREAKGWVERADADLHTVRILLAAEGAPLDVAGFHLQQAAEKLLKAVLTALGIPFPKTHDLAVLVRLVPLGSDFDPDLDLWIELSYFAVLARYPGDRPDLRIDEAMTWQQGVGGLRRQVMLLLEEKPA